MREAKIEKGKEKIGPRGDRGVRLDDDAGERAFFRD